MLPRRLAPSVVPLAALLCLAAPAAAQDAPLQTVPVADGVYMLAGNGGNIGLSIGEDGALLIDDQLAAGVPQIRRAVRELGDRPIRFVVNTHWHGDHTGGNERLGEAGAVVVAHENVRERMSAAQLQSAFGREVAPEAALPVVTFAQDVTFHCNGERIEVFHVAPAHTDGDAIVRLVRANVIHTGDVFVNGSYPFIDVDSDGTLRGMIDAADRVLALADEQTKIIPGHGPLADRAALQRYRAMLADVHARVDALLADGKSCDEVLAARPSAAYDEAWGKGFLAPERWLRIVCASVQRERGPSPAAVDALGIRNLGRPLPRLLTAGQLTEEQFDALLAMGVRLINLRTAGERGTGWEEQRAKSGYVRLPIAGADGLTVENAKRLAAELERAGDAPVCVYCGSSNRVGALLGLKAYAVDGKSADDALALAEAAGATRLLETLRELLRGPK